MVVRKVARGTGNIARGPAMDREQMLEAVKVGLRLVGDLATENVDILGTGDMG
ncbi:MAG: nicotinate-nucleotide--dimethylbenzimidazole phosphoribosyltransferase, partial [Gemmatimonadales bacterium]|nr:nicotinate-nucleotide--dimethylbenzimidazole phosphoribosyltransferase [Gemmatimonadales bacterium]